jgi:hypothetical protein
VSARSRRWDREPETDTDTRFFDLRESGYRGWIDQDGEAVACPSCGSDACTASLTERCNG